MTPLIFVTGGVVSSLGKGISAASLAAILEARGLRVTSEVYASWLSHHVATRPSCRRRCSTAT